MTARHRAAARARLPLPVLAVADRAARRVRALAGGTSAAGAQRTAAFIAERAESLGALAPDLDLVEAVALAVSEDRATYLVRWSSEPAVLKLAIDAAAGRRLAREAHVLRLLERHRVAGTPRLLATGGQVGARFSVETHLAGVSARASGDVTAAATLLAPLHASTAAEIVVDERWLRRNVDSHVSTAGALLRGSLGERHELRRLAALRARLRAALDGRPLRVVLTHGDFWLGNILLDAGGAPSGIIDWDSAACAPPAVDALHLLLYARRRATRAALGAEVVRGVLDPAWREHERKVIELLAPELLGTTAPSLAWLYWLRTVDANVRRHPSLASDMGWIIANVARPLGVA